MSFSSRETRHVPAPVDELETLLPLGTSGRLTIDHAALAMNARILANQVAPARLGAVVKADGYGLGAIDLAPTLLAAGCKYLFVAHLFEARALRSAGVGAEASLFILNGVSEGSEAEAVACGAIPVLNTSRQVASWRDAAQVVGRPLPAAVQVDSGMSRLGLSPEEVAALAAVPGTWDGIDVVLVMSHLACADASDAAVNRAQLNTFDRLANQLPDAPRSLANSGGCLLDQAFHQDVARAGIGLYGGNPADGPNPMREVVRFEGRIIQVRTIPAGAGVGYGLDYVARDERRIATVGLGYADGWPRSLAGRGAAFIDGHRAPLAGRVSMDSLSIDVTDVPQEQVREGVWVELVGPHQSLDDVARQAGTISYEILTRIGRRVARRHINTQGLSA